MVKEVPATPKDIEEADDTISVREARESGDWLFIFKAAKETNVY